MFHRGTGRSAQSAGRAMEDTHSLPSLQCTGTTVLGITPRCVRDISEDADSAITWVGKGWRGSPQGISGSATQGGIHVDERWGGSSSGAQGAQILGGFAKNAVLGKE